MVGRDATVRTNASSDGVRGFSFVQLPGGCVRDEVTGLDWEVKTNDGGLRDWTKTYTYGVGGSVLGAPNSPAVESATACSRVLVVYAFPKPLDRHGREL